MNLHSDKEAFKEIIAVNKPDVFADRLFNGFIPSFSLATVLLRRST